MSVFGDGDDDDDNDVDAAVDDDAVSNLMH